MTRLSKEKARQGRSGRPVLFVLVGGLLLAAALALALHPYQDSEVAGTQTSEENVSVE